MTVASIASALECTQTLGRKKHIAGFTTPKPTQMTISYMLRQVLTNCVCKQQ
jgi:hypothetical protein